MNKQESLLRLQDVINSYLSRQGYVLVDMRIYVNRERRQIIEALVDRPEGGISLGECARINKEVGPLIEESCGGIGDYALEVSSPGLDRPLASPADFKRAIGKKIRFFLREPLDGKLEYCGVVESVREDEIIINTQTTNVRIKLDKLNKAKQVIL